MIQSDAMLPARLPKAQSGFTLIEVMVVVALVAILASLAVPSWTQLLVRNSVRTSINDFSLSLQFARSQAVLLNSPVTLCPSNDGVNCTASDYAAGWIVRVGPAANSAGQRILQDVLQRDRVTITADHAGAQFIFLPNGSPGNGFAGSTVTIAPVATGFATMTRRLCINRTGRIRVSDAVCAV